MSEPKTWRPDSRITRNKERLNAFFRKSQRFEEETAREEHRKELAQSKQEKYGNNKYTKEGIIARIFGEYLLDLSSDKLTKKDLQSFIYGYYEASNRQISLMCTNNIISETIQRAVEELTTSKREEIMSFSIDELLFDIGYRDSKDSTIKKEELNESIRSNQYYSEGYLTGQNEQKGKGTR